MFFDIKYKNALNLNILNIQNIVIILLIKVKKLFFKSKTCKNKIIFRLF